MNKIYLSIIFSCLLCYLSACKKDSSGNNNKTAVPVQNTLIIGNWLSTTDRGRIYKVSDNTLVKDTTLTLNNVSGDFYESFDAHANSYVYVGPFARSGSTVLYNDTSSYLTYSISNNVLKLHQNGDDPNNFENDLILKLNNTNLELEYTYTSTIADSKWNVPQNINFKYIEDITFTKQ